VSLLLGENVLGVFVKGRESEAQNDGIELGTKCWPTVYIVYKHRGFARAGKSEGATTTMSTAML